MDFAATSSTGLCSGTPAYDWDFGDGSAHSSQQNPSHTYSANGSYSWTLTVTVGSATCSKSGTIAIVVPPSVTSMQKLGNPFRINVIGSNLQSGIAVYINGQYWGDSSDKKLVKWKSESNIKVKKGSALKALVPKNTPTTFRFVNPDGGETSLTWQWP